MPKVVIDTSVFIAGLLSKNKYSGPSLIISMWRDNAFILVMSPQILQEIVAKMLDKSIPEDEVVEFVTTMGRIALFINGAYETAKLDAVDASDNMFLAACLESKADFLVSFDSKSLLPIKHFHGTTIYTPELFLRVLYGLNK